MTRPDADDTQALTKNAIDQIRGEICWMIEREGTTTHEAAEKAGLPRMRVDRFLRSETNDFTVEEVALLFSAHGWFISLGSASHADLSKSVDWYDDDEDHRVPRPVEDPAPDLNSEPVE